MYKRVKDNIPGFRDTSIYKVECFDNKEEAVKLENELQENQGGSIYHEGYGAGSGTIDTSFYVECKE